MKPFGDDIRFEIQSEISASTLVREGLALIQRELDPMMDAAYWEWNRKVSAPGPFMFVARTKRELAGTLVIYPEAFQMGAGTFAEESVGGQLCVEENYRNRGLGYALMTRIDQELRIRGISLFRSTAGSRIYKRYYRKRMGIVSVPGKQLCYTYADVGDELAVFCRRARRSAARFPGRLLLDIEDRVSGGHRLVIEGGSVTLDPSRRGQADLRVTGPAWLLFRYLAQGKGKRMLARAVFGRSLRLAGWLRHPLKTLRFTRWLRQVTHNVRT